MRISSAPERDRAFNGLAFIVFLLTAAGGNDEFDMATTGEYFDGDKLETVLFGAGEVAELAFGNEQFEIAGGFGAESGVIQP